MASNHILDINKFKKKNKIGEGGFAKAYIVEEKDTKEIYVSKILFKNIDDIPREEMISLSNEVNIMSKVNHPAIIRFIGFSPVDFKSQEKPVIFIEYALNGSLKQILELERQSASKELWDNTRKLINIYGIASGMMYLHAHDIIHRYLKPDNILMDQKLNPKISDFGLSKINHSKSSTLQSMKGIKGTPIYIAPEIWDNQQYGKSGDVYSFSLIAYEIVTNEIPFKDIASISQIYTKIVIGGYRPEFTFPIPASYRNLIEKCWSYDPNDRPSFGQIVEDLKNDPGFITDTVDKDEFMEYVDYVEEYKSTFDEEIQVIKLNKNSQSENKAFQLVTVDSNQPQKIVEVEEIESDKIKSEEEIDEIIKSAEGDVNKEFIIGKSFLEGLNGFPTDSIRGIKFLKRASKGGSVDSTVYYSNLLIEGKHVPKNIQKAKKYLSKSLSLKEPAIYELYSKIQNEEKIHKKDDDDEIAESPFERGKYYFNKAIQYLLNSDKNGSEFLSKYVNNLNELIGDEKDSQNEMNKQQIKHEEVDYYNEDDDDVFYHLYQEELPSLLLRNPPIEGRKRAVLVSTGSFCPIHKGHLKLFDTAARFLCEEYQIDSILGIISPTSDIYVAPKFGSSSITFEHRYEMTKLACLEHNKDAENDPHGLKIIPDSWEGTRIDFLDFHIVYDYFKSKIKQEFHDENLLVLYVCGGDLFIKRKCHLRNGFVGISRPGFQIVSSTDVKKHLYVCNDKKYAGAYSDASFAINLAKESGESIEGLTYDSVAKYLHEVVHWI